MTIKALCITALITAAASSHALADIPQMGGGMSHLLVSIFDQQVFVTLESPSMATVEMTQGAGAFSGSASILDGLGHNSQFGWLANGFISLPPSSGVFVRTLGGSQHLSVYSEFGYEPILGTDGSNSIWQWDGSMTHNWYASDVKGPHAVRYEVFVGDLAGNPLDGWTSGNIELNFTYGPSLDGRIGTLNGGPIPAVPAPGSLALLAGGLILTRRQRTL